MRKNLIFVLLLMISLTASAQKPVYDLLNRVSKGADKKFLLEITNSESKEDFFVLNQKGSKVWIQANSNLSLAVGLNWYLKYHAGVHISWNNPTADLSGKLPAVKTPERRSTNLKDRTYLNYCTFSYSMAFWGWERWQQEIDWMAIHGVTMPLAITGTQSVWRNTLLRLGYSKDEVNEFIAGPAHQAWWLMNNLEGWGGPNKDQYYQHQEDLQKKILARYREWGIEPVLPGYSGMIPRNADKKLGLNIQDPGLWCGFKRPAFLQPEDPRFGEIADIYYQELTKLYGVSKYYSMDPFHEGGSIAGVNLANAGKAIYNAMCKANPKGVWVAQSWQSNPYQKMIDAVPEGQVLVLDLFSESRPQWGDPKSTWFRADAFGHHGWLYCMLLNFGGNVGIYGKLQRVVDGFYLAKDHKNGAYLRGVGATPEGIENNPVMYELLFELPWRDKKFDTKKWLSDMVKARYGKYTPEVDKAWDIIAETALNAPYEGTQEGTTESVFCGRPALSIPAVSSWATAKMYYDPARFEEAFTLMNSVKNKYKGNNNFDYDIVDIERQTLANKGNVMLPKLKAAYEAGDWDQFKKLSDEFLDLILKQDALLSTRPEFRTDTWLKMARAMGNTDEEKDWYEWNARTLITVWGNRYAANKGGLRDYSHREWNGILKGFYYPRWKFFFDYINENKQLPQVDYFEMEYPWTVETLNLN